jgi:GH24 family phage-related lysozyme (muramidase)
MASNDQTQTLTLIVDLKDNASTQLGKIKEGMRDVERGSRESRDRFKKDLEEIQNKLMGGMGVRKFVDDMSLVTRTLRGVTYDAKEGQSGLSRFAIGFAAVGFGAAAAIEAVFKIAEGLQSIVKQAQAVKLSASSLGLDPAQFERARIGVEVMGGTVENLSTSLANLGKASAELHKAGGGQLRRALLGEAKDVEGMDRFITKFRDATDPFQRLQMVIEARQNVINNLMKEGEDQATATARANEFAAQLGVDPVTAQLTKKQLQDIIEMSRTERDEVNRSLQSRADAAAKWEQFKQSIKERTGLEAGKILSGERQDIYGGIRPRTWKEIDEATQQVPGGLQGGINAIPLFSDPGLPYPYNQMRQSTNIIDRRDEYAKALSLNTEQLVKLNNILAFNLPGGGPGGGSGLFGPGGGRGVFGPGGGGFRPGIGPGRGGGGGTGSAKMSDEAGVLIDPETEKEVEAAAKRGDVGGMQKILNEKGFQASGLWCGRVAAGYAKAAGYQPPEGSAIASNWLKWGQHASPADINKGHPFGSMIGTYRHGTYGSMAGQPLGEGQTGGHVMQVLPGSYNPKTNTALFVDRHGVRYPRQLGDIELRYAGDEAVKAVQAARGKLSSATGDASDLDAVSRWVRAKESFKGTAFWDFGSISIGYGTAAAGRTSITEPAARAEMRQKLKESLDRINELNPNLSHGQKLALASLDFNTGWTQRPGEKNEALRAAVSGGHLGEARELFGTYTHVGGPHGRVLPGLASRRREELSIWDKADDARSAIDGANGTTHTVKGGADLNVNVKAPAGTDVSTNRRGDLFKKVETRRQTQMAPAARGPITPGGDPYGF